MKNLILAIVMLLSLNMPSCYIEDTSPCIPIVNYQTQTYFNNYPYPPVIKIYFYETCDYYGTQYRLLVQDNIYGTEWINGRYWRFASVPSGYSPIIARADYTELAPNRIYRALIISDYGTLSQEFTLYTY